MNYHQYVGWEAPSLPDILSRLSCFDKVSEDWCFLFECRLMTQSGLLSGLVMTLFLRQTYLWILFMKYVERDHWMCEIHLIVFWGSATNIYIYFWFISSASARWHHGIFCIKVLKFKIKSWKILNTCICPTQTRQSFGLLKWLEWTVQQEWIFSWLTNLQLCISAYSGCNTNMHALRLGVMLNLYFTTQGGSRCLLQNGQWQCQLCVCMCLRACMCACVRACVCSGVFALTGVTGAWFNFLKFIVVIDP